MNFMNKTLFSSNRRLSIYSKRATLVIYDFFFVFAFIFRTGKSLTETFLVEAMFPEAQTVGAVIFAGGQFHCVAGASLASGSHGFHPSIFLANNNSFSAWTITSSICPQLICFSMSVTSVF